MKRCDTVIRYIAPERINHWATVFCFILATVSRLGFLFSPFSWLMRIMGTPQLAYILHPFAGMVMLASFAIMFFRYWHHNLTDRDDIFWVENICKIVINGEVGDTGRYNFDQKCIFWTAVVFLVLLLVSGVIIWRLYFASVFPIPVIRFTLMPYSFAAVALIVATMAHVCAALWMKGTITAIVGGWMTSVWAKKRHPRWYREVRKTTEKKAK